MVIATAWSKRQGPPSRFGLPRSLWPQAAIHALDNRADLPTLGNKSAKPLRQGAVGGGVPHCVGAMRRRHAPSEQLHPACCAAGHTLRFGLE